MALGPQRLAFVTVTNGNLVQRGMLVGNRSIRWHAQFLSISPPGNGVCILLLGLAPVDLCGVIGPQEQELLVLQL